MCDSGTSHVLNDIYRWRADKVGGRKPLRGPQDSQAMHENVNGVLPERA